MEHNVYVRMAEIQDRHWWYEARRHILAHLIAQLDLPEATQILEAGCGPGANLAMLAEFGNVQAFEPDNFALEYCHQHSGIRPDRIRQGFLPEPIPFDTTYDLVCAFDVIEHIDDDAASIKALYNMTKAGGYALFTVPAFMSLWSQHDVVNHHKRRYLKEDFERLLKKAGYKVEMISYYNTILFPLVALIRQLKKKFNIKDRPDESLPRFAFINKALTLIFSAERHFLGKFYPSFGVSIIAVCSKPDQGDQ